MAADSLPGSFGEILKMYHLYSAQDGRSYIGVMDAPPMKTPIGLVSCFDRQVRRVVIGYWPDGEFNDFHHAVNQAGGLHPHGHHGWQAEAVRKVPPDQRKD